MPQDLAPKPTISATGIQVTGQRLSTSGVTSFAAFNTSFTDYVAIDVQGQDCYVTFDGGAPSATAGVQWYAGQSYFVNVLTAQNLKAIAQTGSGTIQGYEFTSIPGDTQLPDTNVVKIRPPANQGLNPNNTPTFAGLTITGTATISGITVPAHVQTRQVFTSGSGTYTTPAGARWIIVRMQGGGGGGAGAGTSAGGNGGSGSSSTFGTAFLTCNGGPGATYNAGFVASGGTATGGDFNITGGGQGGASNTGNLLGAFGGISFFGGAGFGGTPGNIGTPAQANTGSGGGGGGGTAGSFGGNGAGCAGGYLEKLIAPPAATYAYVVGALGAGGIAGVAGVSGGSGSAGIIIVEEFYSA